MTIKEVIIHQKDIEGWTERKKLPLPLKQMERVLAHIDQRVDEALPENAIFVHDSPNTHEFKSLAEQVGQGNTARVMGARALYCVATAINLLEDGGIETVYDSKGILP